jgi:hypothetical protein
MQFIRDVQRDNPTVVVSDFFMGSWWISGCPFLDSNSSRNVMGESPPFAHAKLYRKVPTRSGLHASLHGRIHPCSYFSDLQIDTRIIDRFPASWLLHNMKGKISYIPESLYIRSILLGRKAATS